ncbi:MAG: flavodoxin [Deltaproteobacteria bacterium]|nr:MAG: flavodoxin [Deltaproteobacteria bacterium]
MKKALIVFGSSTGNTETMSEKIAEALGKADVEAELKNVTDAQPSDMAGEYDLVLLGCPAYGDEEVELQDDFQDFYDDMDGVALEGKKCAAFAPGDSSYEHFCGTVDMLEKKLGQIGGDVVVEGLKIDGDPLDALSDINEWAEKVAGAL